MVEARTHDQNATYDYEVWETTQQYETKKQIIKEINQLFVYPVDQKAHNFAECGACGNLVSAVLNGKSNRTDNPELEKMVEELRETLPFLTEEEARRLATALQIIHEKTGKATGALLQNAEYYINATTKEPDLAKNLKAGIFGNQISALKDGVASERLKAQGVSKMEWSGFSGVKIVKDAQGDVYYTYQGQIIDGGGFVVALNENGEVIGQIKIDPNADKTYAVYDAYKKLSGKEGVARIYYLRRGSVIEKKGGQEVEEGALILEKLSTQASGHTNYYGESFVQQMWIKNVKGQVALLQLRTMNVDGGYQQWYRIIPRKDLAKASEAALRWGEMYTPYIWMKFGGEKSLEKRAKEGWRNEIGENIFASSDALGGFYQEQVDNQQIWLLKPGFVYGATYGWEGAIIDGQRVPPLKVEDPRVGFLSPTPTLVTTEKPKPQPPKTEKPQEPEQETAPPQTPEKTTTPAPQPQVSQPKPYLLLQAIITGREKALVGTFVDYLLNANIPSDVDLDEYTLPLQRGYLVSALVARKDGLWIAAPGREIEYEGEKHKLTSQYVGELIGTELRIYLDDQGNVVDHRTNNYITLDLNPTYKPELAEANKLLGGVFFTENNSVKIRIDGETSVFAVAAGMDQEPISDLATYNTAAVYRQTNVEHLGSAPLNELVELPGVTFSYTTGGMPEQVEQVNAQYLPYFTTKSGIKYAINTGFEELAGHTVGKDVKAIGRIGDGGKLYIKVNNGQVQDAYTGTGAEIPFPLEEVFRPAKIEQKNGAYLVKGDPVDLSTYSYEEAKNITDVGALYKVETKVVGQEDSFERDVSREVYAVAPPQPPKTEKPQKPQEPEQETAPPQTPEKTTTPAPEPVVKPQPKTVQITLTLQAPAVIVAGDTQPYAVRMEFNEAVDKALLFGVEPLQKGGSYLYITNPQSLTVKLAGQELVLDPEEVRNLGLYKDGKLYIYYKDGKIVDPTIGSDKSVVLEIGETPQEWTKNMPPELLSLFAYPQENVKEAVFEVLPAAGTKVLWYGVGIKDGEIADVKEAVSEYATLQAQTENKSFNVEESTTDPAPAELTLKAQVGEQEANITKAAVKATAVYQYPQDNFGIVVDKQGRAIAYQFMYNGDAYYLPRDEPMPLANEKVSNLHSLRQLGMDLAERVRELVETGSVQSKEEFLQAHPEALLEATVQGDRAIVDINGYVPVPGRMVYNWDVTAEVEGVPRSLHTTATTIHSYNKLEFQESAEQYMPELKSMWTSRNEERVSIDYSAEPEAILARTAEYVETPLPNSREAQELIEGLAFFWPTVKREAGHPDENIPAGDKSGREYFNKIFTTLRLPKEYTGGDQINVFTLVVLGYNKDEGSFNVYRPGVELLSDLLAEIDVNKVREDLEKYDPVSFYSGNVSEDVKKALTLMVILNPQITNGDLGYSPFKPFFSEEEAEVAFSNFKPVMEEALELIEHMQKFQAGTESSKELYEYVEGVNGQEGLKKTKYWNDMGSAHPLLRSLFEGAAESIYNVTLVRKRLSEVDLMRIGIDVKLWEKADDQTKALLLWRTLIVPFLRTTEEVVMEKNEEGEYEVTSKESSLGLGAKVDTGLAYEFADRAQNLRAEVEIGGKIYVIEKKTGEPISFFPTGLLEEAHIVGTAVYTRNVYETDDLKIEVYTRATGKYSWNLSSNTELVIFMGRVGMIAKFDKQEDGEYVYKVKGAYTWNYRDGTWSQQMDIDGTIRVSPDGKLTLGMTGLKDDRLISDIRAGLEWAIDENMSLSAQVSKNLSDGEMRLTVGLNIAF